MTRRTSPGSGVLPFHCSTSRRSSVISALACDFPSARPRSGRGSRVPLGRAPMPVLPTLRPRVQVPSVPRSPSYPTMKDDRYLSLHFGQRLFVSAKAEPRAGAMGATSAITSSAPSYGQVLSLVKITSRSCGRRGSTTHVALPRAVVREATPGCRRLPRRGFGPRWPWAPPASTGTTVCRRQLIFREAVVDNHVQSHRRRRINCLARPRLPTETRAPRAPTLTDDAPLLPMFSVTPLAI